MPTTVHNITVSPAIFLSMVGNQIGLVESKNGIFLAEFGSGFDKLLVFCHKRNDLEAGGHITSLLDSWEKFAKQVPDPVPGDDVIPD